MVTIEVTTITKGATMKKVLFPIIRSELAKRGMTQSDLAEHLCLTRISLSRKINGINQFNLREVLIMMELFELTFEELMKQEA